MCRRALLAATLAIATSVAAAAEFPTISIERTCRGAQPLDAQETRPVETCARDEREARSQLEAQWAKFAEHNRRLCVEQTNLGDSPSYVEVLTCLQMYDSNASGASAPQAPVWAVTEQERLQVRAPVRQTTASRPDPG